MKTALVALALLAVGVAAGIATTVLVLDDDGDRGRSAGSEPTATDGNGDDACERDCRRNVLLHGDKQRASSAAAAGVSAVNGPVAQ